MRPLLFCGLLGAAIGFAAAPHRIVSASPNLTEILYGVGAFDRVVAVSDFCTYPPAAQKLPRVGGWSNPNLEKLALLRPDLVILTDAQAPFVESQLQQLGVRTLVTPSRTLDDVFRSIAEIGSATGDNRQARELAAQIRGRLDRIRSRSRALPHPKVLCVVARTPGTLHDLYVVTRGSYLADLIAIAGGALPNPSSPEGYSRLTAETLVTLNPDVILDLVHGEKTALSEDPIRAWQDLPELKAVRSHRVYPVVDDYVVHASQMVVKTALLFARLLHPEVPASEWEGQ
ncbi:MAG TPA: helical backbone metal receptor [Bryobacteraceae bacterium]|nr:helical backbone metal receptor [Bryobacteraceae bacterium]